ncbi:ABC transporter substrate-binding protein [Leifsonia aquatica]|uniref:ABC transporter substrate-binding protein n=1 Tax=Leifsonia aquatica TaxID=144185 RepID=UPI00384F21FB
MRTAARITAITAMALTAAGLTGCSGGSDGGGQDAPIEFWGWAPGYKEAVAEWNSTHDQKVVFQTIASGGAGGYTKMQAAVKAGNGPCLGQVGNESMASFVLDGSLVDISREAAAYEKDYSEAAFSVMHVGDGVYGIPVDTAPMGMFYRADVYEKFGLSPATTWDEFAQQAAAVHSADPNTYLSSFGPTDASLWGGLTQQAGGTWFSASDDAWKVSVDAPQSQKVADYWQKQIDAGTVKVTESDTPEWYEALQAGTIATAFEPVWWAGVVEGAAGNSAGAWRVAPLPNFSAQERSNGTIGGSATSVLKGCKNVQGAVDFANWMSTDSASISLLIKKGALFPASEKGQTNPALQDGVDFFGGQKIFQEFTAVAADIDPAWAWGPLTSQTNSALKDAMTPVSTGTGTLREGLATAQAAVVAAFTAKGLSTK